MIAPELIRHYGYAAIAAGTFFEGEMIALAAGVATVTPVAFGMTRIRTARFMGLDLAGNALWTSSFSLAGYVCGSALIALFAGLPFWIPLVGWALVAATVTWFVLRRRVPSVRA